MSLDETTEAGQGTPSGNPGQSSGSKGGNTSKDKGKLYTAAEITKIKSDAAAEAGRLRVKAEQERDALKQDLESTTSRLDTLEREINESRLTEARGDPDTLRLYNREQAIKARETNASNTERDLARREAQLKSDLETITADRGVVTIAYLAAKHGLETEELESLGISDPEILEKVAEKLAAVKPKEPREGEPEEGEEEFEPDSGAGKGGVGAPLTTESVETMSIASVEKALGKAEKSE